MGKIYLLPEKEMLDEFSRILRRKKVPLKIFEQIYNQVEYKIVPEIEFLRNKIKKESK
jgi:penicillin-binding protein-related factor A (putative recombinase)